MPHRRTRLSLVFAALCAVFVAALLAYDPADPPQPASAELDCVPQAGDHRIDGALLHVPRRAHAGLVLAFHGAGGTGDGFVSEAKLTAAADRLGFAVLYPSAASRNFWSLNRSMGTRDLDTVRALLPRALAAACTDKVFATGVSNGGGFTARVGCELENVRAIAPVAGGYRALDACPGKRRVSVLEIHGTGDTVVPYQGRAPDYKGSVPRYLAGWARRDGCRGKPVASGRGGTTRLTYQHCARGLHVEHLRLAGVQHGWPDGAADAVLRFFARIG
ncbi:MAG TPA: PHB depolymerase family esterase [Solirubrobacter sp.]|nr:PHB depolymerase family esterase [Solirubrobacter sp.]